MARKPTAKDVAELAGVARSAVSMVVNGRGEGMVAPERRERILAAADELGYRPHSVGRSLRNQRTQTIGLVTDQIASSAFGGRLIQGATDIAMEAGYLLLTVDIHGDRSREASAYEALLHREVDALMFAALSLNTYQPPPPPRDRPAILANCFDPSGSIPGVIADEVEGGRQGAMLLLEAGHRDVLVLGGDPLLVAMPRRLAGIEQELAAVGLPMAEVISGGEGWEIANGVRAGTEALSRTPRPTGLICANDRVAIGAYIAAARLGLEVPTDVSIVGYDDDENVAPRLLPGLSTVALPHHAIGEATTRALVDHLDRGVPLPVGDLLLPCERVERESVAAPSR